MAATTQAFIPTFSPHRETLLVVLATMKTHQKGKRSWGRKWGERKGKRLRLRLCHLRDKEKGALLINGWFSTLCKMFLKVSFEEELA